MRRRSLLRLLAAVPLAAVLPRPTVPSPPALVFHPDAFAMCDQSVGISVRLIRNYDVMADQQLSKLDILMVQPDPCVSGAGVMAQYEHTLTVDR